MKLTLIKKRPEVGDVTTLIFESKQPVTWQAGQFIEYQLPHSAADDRGSKRWFTISAAPFERNIQITTRFFEKPSSFKRTLSELKIGDEIEAGEPEGDFTLDDPTKAYVFIAGGIGITPMRSILAQAGHDGIALDVELLYGNRSLDTTVFLPELESLAQQNPKLKVHNVLEPKRIDAELIKTMPGFQSKTFYVSGPEPMVEAFEKILENLGIPEDHQKRDYFPGYEY